VLPPSPPAPYPQQNQKLKAHRPQSLSFRPIGFGVSLSSHLFSTITIFYFRRTFHVLPLPHLIPSSSVYRIHVISTFSVYISIIHTSSYLLCISISRRVSSCHVISSCHTVILHMSSCHVSTCHDIVSYHISYHCVFTFVT